jgi:hypothetical protein
MRRQTTKIQLQKEIQDAACILIEAENLQDEKQKQKSVLDSKVTTLQNELLAELKKLNQRQKEEVDIWDEETADATWFKNFIEEL